MHKEDTGPHVDLNFRQMVALADIVHGYHGDDSPATDGRTLWALFRRHLVDSPERESTVTERGHVWARAAIYEVAIARGVKQRTAARSRRSVEARMQ